MVKAPFDKGGHTCYGSIGSLSVRMSLLAPPYCYQDGG